MAIRTFLDTGVLFAAHRGRTSERESALAILNDRFRAFIASPFLYLETMPKAVYFHNTAEIQFYQTYFNKVLIWINDVESIVRIAREEAERSGLAALDALHVAAAHLGEAAVLFTLERKDKAIHRAGLVRVQYLESD